MNKERKYTERTLISSNIDSIYLRSQSTFEHFHLKGDWGQQCQNGTVDVARKSSSTVRFFPKY